MQHQSLYRRFRPQRFAEVVGQPHLVRALRNAVSENRVGHAYLLSGPRGTGKTSTARILAKALNCEALSGDGEPCDNCASCDAIAAGRSLDLIELDAASNNSVNHIRDMIEKAALVSAGQRKVYLLDEVHMLSAAASNALLKTLEEPPPHVVFILATTDPNKVLSTIRSRTQQFELSLVGAEDLAPHIRAVADAAGISVDDAVVDYVTERGAGSVRDALSALDTVLAAGGIPDDRADVNALVQALARADLAATLISVAQATAAGVDARDLAERTARRLRDMFLVGAGVEPAELPQADIASARHLSAEMGRRANVRALEALGAALAQMPQSADRRLTLEAALVGLLADEALGTGATSATADAAAASAGPRAPTTLAPSGPAAARAAMAATTAPPSLDAAPAPAPLPPPPVAETPTPLPPVPAEPAALPPAPPFSPGRVEPQPVGAGPAATPPVPSASSEAAAPQPASPAESSEAPARPAARPSAESDADPASASTRTSVMTAADLQGIWDTRVVEKLRPFASGLFRDAEILARERNVVTIRLGEGVPVEQARRRSNEVEAVLSDLLDQTIRLEVSDERATATDNPAPPTDSEPSSSPPSQDVPPGASQPAVPAVTEVAGSISPPTAATSHEAKVQRIVDRFPGSVVVRDDGGAA